MTLGAALQILMTQATLVCQVLGSSSAYIMCVHAVLFFSFLSTQDSESQHGCVNTMVLSLQAFGLAVLMARAGLAIPAEAPVQLPACSAVLADIGDEQSLSANLSTFSGHLRRIQVKPLLLFLHPYTFFLFHLLLLVFTVMAVQIQTLLAF